VLAANEQPIAVEAAEAHVGAALGQVDALRSASLSLLKM